MDIETKGERERAQWQRGKERHEGKSCNGSLLIFFLFSFSLYVHLVIFSNHQASLFFFLFLFLCEEKRQILVGFWVELIECFIFFCVRETKGEGKEGREEAGKEK